MKKIILSILLLTIFSCKNDKKNTEENLDTAQKEMTILLKVANAYGYENWENVENLKFSFVVNPGENERLRSWQWNTLSQEVTMTAQGKSTTYNRSDVKEEFRSTDRAFVNDSFWLLFPFHLVWDDIEYEVSENSISPIKKLETTKLVVKYPKEGGYTPGDKYEVYLNENYHIVEWTYHPKGQEEAALANTFEELSDFSGIKVNMAHSNPENGFQLNFRDVSFE